METSKKAAAVFVDQAVSSATNFLVVVLAARVLSSDAFGSVAVGLVIAALVVQSSRALFLEPVLIGLVDFARSKNSGFGASAILSVGLSLPAMALALIFIDGAQLVLLIGCVFVPTLCWQDLGRYLAFGEGRAGVALASDIVWMATLAASFWMLDINSADAVIAVNAGAALTGLFVSFLAGIFGHNLAGSWPLLKSAVAEGKKFFTEQVLAIGSFNLALVGAGLVGGAILIGPVRAAAGLIGPFTVLHQALYVLASRRVPDLTELGVRPARIASGLSVSLALAAALYSAFILRLPDWVGQEILGETWEEVAAVRGPVVASLIAGTLLVGPYIVLRTLGHGGVLVRLRIVVAPAVVIVPIAATAVWGLGGFFVGVAMMQVVQAALFFRKVRSLREPLLP